MSDVIGVYGAAGCGRGILPILRIQYPRSKLVFIDDELGPGTANGADIVGWNEFQKFENQGASVCLAVSNPSVRSNLYEKCMGRGIPVVEARASNVVQMDNVELGVGACLSPFVTLTSNIRVGLSLHANLYSYIEHDCVVGDFVTLAPGAKVNGNIVLEDYVYVGAGAVIRQGLRVGAGAIIGMGAVVTRDVPPGVVVVGNPAVAMNRRLK
ncbi:acetyltransferase [Rhodobacterales bacterium LSUCC0246]|nr:acetyltransferase [Rhodobacterales bacterium LSUCC0374]